MLKALNSKEILVKNVSKALLLATSVFVVTPTYAGWGDVLPKKESKKSSGDAYGMSEKLVKTYASAMGEILTAQSYLATAFGNKDRAAELAAQADVMKSGSVDEDAIEKATEVSKQANAEISKKVADGEKLTAESKKQYIKAFAPYVKGLLKTKGVIEEAKPFMDSAKDKISSAGFTEKLSVKEKLAAGMYVATKTPSYAKDLWETSQKLVTYNMNNKIKVPNDPTASIGDDFF